VIFKIKIEAISKTFCLKSKLLLILVLLFQFSTILGQKYTISGYVRDKKNGEDLIGSSVYVKELLKGTTTNTYGFFSLTLPKGEYTLTISYLGYSDFTKKIVLDKDLKINLQLEEAVIMGKEVLVTGERTNKNVESIDMGRVSLSIEKIKSIPAFLGEVDIIKTIKMIPGVSSGGDGNAGFYVRGGGPDQNLILLDDAVVYNASHLFGFFSVFNADAVKDVNLIKGGMPAQYGGRLSSVLDVTMKEGNNREYQVDGGIGVISSRLTIQGPIKKDTSSFILSGRRTYIDVLMKPFMKDNLKGTGYYFYDLNTKINYRFSDKNRLFLSGYFGRDVFTYKNKKDGFLMKFPWGNSTASMRWNHVFNSKLFLNTTGTYSDYKLQFEGEMDAFEFKMFSGVRDYSIKSDFTWFPNVLHNFKFGVNYIYHIFTPSSATAKIGNTEYNSGETIKYYANDFAVYISDEYDINENIKISAGVRGTFFQQIGPFTRYLKDDLGRNQDTAYYKRGDDIASFKHAEPRASIRFSLSKNSSLKASFTQNYQYIHLASMSSGAMPTDVWIPCTSLIKPQFATQYAVGFFKNFRKDMFETSVEVYYKEMKNLIDYKEGATSDDDMGNNPDNNFTFGKGKSYGVELFLKKRLGKFNGWVGYTLAKTTRQFDEINLGKEYPAKYDRRHDLTLTLAYDMNPRWSFGFVFVYATGDAITLPIARYLIEGRIISEYGDRNSFRMKPYNRADISITYTFPNKKKRKWNSTLNFSIFNLYNRYNPYFIYFDTETDLENYKITTTAKQVSLFSILPSLTYNFKF
jgi:outer membrane cobalamin receptor